MSDPKSSYGEPVDEPTGVDADVVGRAHEGLADAEAARQSIEPAEPGAEPAASAPSAADTADAAPAAAAEPVADAPWYEREDEDEARWAAYAASADAPEVDTPVTPVAPAPGLADEAPTVVAAPVVAPAVAPAAAPAPAAELGGIGQPIFVQAPEAPAARGNRGAASAIGLLAALSFAALSLAAALALGLIYGDITVNELGTAALAALTTWSLWVPVVVFYLAFCLLGSIINRGGWGHWVVWGLLVGVAAWGGQILGVLFQAPFWNLTTREGGALVESQLLAPLTIVAFVLGRELTIWFGAWVAARGRRMTELNLEAQREYERTLEAGPQLSRG